MPSNRVFDAGSSINCLLNKPKLPSCIQDACNLAKGLPQRALMRFIRQVLPIES
jgi:hypothetical protein